MTPAHMLAAAGVLATVYGLVRNQSVFSLAGVGAVVWAMLMFPPPPG
jgi:hypothetical protein